MITSNEVQQQLQKYFGNIGAVTALPADPAFPSDPPRFEVQITGGKLGAGFLKAIEFKTGFQAEFVLKQGEPREDVIHLSVPETPAPAIAEPPVDPLDTRELPRSVIEAANAEASVNQPELTTVEVALVDDEPLPDLDPPTYAELKARNADLLTCVRLLEGLHDEDQQTLQAYRLVNQAQSQMLREEIVLPEAKPPTRVEVKTLMHQPAYADADRELATALSEGWQMLHAAVYVNPADEMTWRTVTLIREAAAPQPQPEKAAVERDPLLQGGARNGVFPPMRKPGRVIIDHHPLPTVYAQSFAEQNPLTAAIVNGSVPAWKAGQNQAQLDAAKAEFRASLADVPDFKPLPTLLKAGEPS